MRALTRWRLGKNRRFVIAVTCVPIPPDFLALPLRQMMLPFIGRFPVTSQILAITISFQKEPKKLPVKMAVARIISDNFRGSLHLFARGVVPRARPPAVAAAPRF